MVCSIIMKEQLRIKKLGVLVHPSKNDAAALAKDVETACRVAGVESILARSGEAETLEDAQAIAVLGGDGTILRALRLMNGRMRPVLGVNLGTVGFLAECAPEGVREAVERLAAGDYRLEERMLLRVEGEGVASALALNDVVISRGSCQRVLQTEIFVDGQQAARYSGDGAVIASPTGSTAYSLSAGGPVVVPDMDCMVLAPVCPHTFSARPMVIGGASEVRAQCAARDADGALMVSIDGAPGITLTRADILVKRAVERLPFVRFEEDRFFSLLREKLSLWGGNAQREGEILP